VVQTEVTAAAATAGGNSKKMKSPPKEMRGRQTPHNIVAAKTTVPEQFAQERTLQLLCIIAQSLGRIEKLLQSESRNELLFVANRGGSRS
jgi:hypothetical protein